MSVSFEHANLDLGLRETVLEIIQAALVGADPYRAVRKAMDVHNGRLELGGEQLEWSESGDVFVVGVGKAAAAMAQAAEDIFGDDIAEGVVSVKDGYGLPTDQVAVGETAHPVPDERSMKAARALARVAGLATREDLVVALISGGGSSAIELPAGELSLEALRETTTTLLASGLPIEEMNAVRKHLSSVKGGRLAELIAPAPHATVVVSDVVGDRLDAIASGPTVPDGTTYREALAVLEGAELDDRVPSSVIAHLEAGADGEYPETPTESAQAFEHTVADVVTSREEAAEAASKAAAGAGFNPHVVTTDLEGEAKDVGRRLVEEAGELLERGEPVPPPASLLYAGETTVTMQGQGRGGRNQELALSAAVELEHIEEELDRDIAVAAFATDGTDGPTDAAGAIVDAQTAARAREAGFDPVEELQENNSYPVLEATGDLIHTGPTCNNVNDLICVLID